MSLLTYVLLSEGILRRQIQVLNTIADCRISRNIMNEWCGDQVF